MLKCTGCGSTETIEEIRAKHPKALSCCPERDMQEADWERTINLTPEDFEEFERAIAEPGAPNDRLINLLRGYTVISQKKR